MSFSLSASLDRKAIHADFVDHGYAQVMGVLPTENAGRIHKGLGQIKVLAILVEDEGPGCRLYETLVDPSWNCRKNPSHGLLKSAA